MGTKHGRLIYKHMTHEELTHALELAKNQIAFVQMYISNESSIVHEETAEAYLWDAIKSINRALEFIQPNPYK
jgi:hypothetical protein